MILDDDDSDEAEGASSDVNIGHMERESADTSGLWYDIEEGRYVEEPAPGPGHCEQ